MNCLILSQTLCGTEPEHIPGFKSVKDITPIRLTSLEYPQGGVKVFIDNIPLLTCIVKISLGMSLIGVAIPWND